MAPKKVKVSQVEEKLKRSRSLSTMGSENKEEPWNPFIGSKVSWFVPEDDGEQGELQPPKDHYYKQRRKTANRDNRSTPYTLMMSSLHNLKANLLELKRIFDDEKLTANKAPVYTVDFDSPVESNTENCRIDIATLRNIINESIAEVNLCIETMNEAGALHQLPQHMALRHLDNMLYDELQRASETNSDFAQVSDHLANTFMESNPSSKTSIRDIDEADCMIHTAATKKPSMAIARRNYSFTSVMQLHGIATADISQLLHILTGIDHWNLDVFKLDLVCGRKPLTCITYTLFQKYNLMETFKIPSETLMRYLLSVEESYLDNPYHNNLHAATVTHSTHYFLRAIALDNVLSRLEVLAVIVAATILDVGHPGVNNQFLMDTNSELAELYNTDSILEHHHLAVAFRLQQNDNCDIFANLDTPSWRYVRQMIADIVLSTNKKNTNVQLATLKILVDDVKGKSMQELPWSQRVELLKVLVHCADVGNPARPLDQYRNWVGRVMDELFQQGEEERRQGLPISPMCDRRHANIPQTQITFIDFIVQPIFVLLAELLYPHINGILDIINENKEFYTSMRNSAEEAATPFKSDKGRRVSKFDSADNSRRASAENTRRISCQLIHGRRFTFGGFSESTGSVLSLGMVRSDNIRFYDEAMLKSTQSGKSINE